MRYIYIYILCGAQSEYTVGDTVGSVANGDVREGWSRLAVADVLISLRSSSLPGYTALHSRGRRLMQDWHETIHMYRQTPAAHWKWASLFFAFEQEQLLSTIILYLYSPTVCQQLTDYFFSCSFIYLWNYILAIL